MGGQKGKKNILAKLIYQSSQLSWFLKTKWKTIAKSKKGDFMELFLPKNDFRTCSAVNFLKKHAVLEPWKPTKDMNFKLEFFFTCPSTYECIIT